MRKVPYTLFKKFLGKVRPCGVCNNNSNYRKKNIWATDRYFKAIKCEKCSFISIDPCIKEVGLKKYYENDLKRRLIAKKRVKLRESQYINDKNFIEKYINSGKVLDVGCSGGYFLSCLNGNFKKYGIDIDATTKNSAINDFNINIDINPLGKDPFKENFFDLIIFRGVIEHIYNPKKAIDRCYKLLKKNGFLFFCATPNADSFAAWLYRSNWSLWHPIQHINIFSQKTLYELCGKKKFKLIDTDFEYINTPYANPELDYKKILEDIKNSKRKILKTSPPFWGSMMSLILQKK